MIYPTAAPFQDCMVPLIPNEKGDHVSTTYLGSSKYSICVKEHSHQWRLIVDLPASRIGPDEIVEVSARMHLVGTRVLEGKEDAWSHVGVDFDGEIRYSYTFDGFPTENEVDNRLSEALSFFEAHGYLLEHASLNLGEKDVRPRPIALEKRAKATGDWFEDSSLDEMASEDPGEVDDCCIDDMLRAIDARIAELENSEAPVIPTSSSDGDIDFCEDDFESVVESPGLDGDAILSMPRSWNANVEHDDIGFVDGLRWPRWYDSAE